MRENSFNLGIWLDSGMAKSYLLYGNMSTDTVTFLSGGVDGGTQKD